MQDKIIIGGNEKSLDERSWFYRAFKNDGWISLYLYVLQYRSVKNITET